MADSVTADWGWLPLDVLDYIVDLIDEFSDFVSFAFVCKPWHSTAFRSRRRQQLLHLLKTCCNKLPMLLTSAPDNSDHNRSLFSVTEGAIYQIQMPIPCNRRFSGSSQGWLFMVDKSMNITLINPFLNKRVVLPKFEVPDDEEYWRQLNNYDDHDYYIVKAILLPQSAQNQGGDDFEVLLTFGSTGDLAYFKSRDALWKFITPDGYCTDQLFTDIISYKGQVYAVNECSALVIVDVVKEACKIVIAGNYLEPPISETDSAYLVESQDGDLLLVKRFFLRISSKMHMTRKFEVYKLSWEQAGNPNWVRIEKIGEQALFLGDNYSMSVSTRDFPQCKSNSIYYTDDYINYYKAYVPRENDDSGIYNMEDGSFTRHYVPSPSFCPSQRSIWIVPEYCAKVE